MIQAACRGMTLDENGVDLFFPGRGQSAQANRAKQVCMTCPVFKNCEDYKRVTESTDGIWAGRQAREI